MAPPSFASVSVLPVTSALSGLPLASALVAELAAKLCSKSWRMSSMCSYPTDIRIMSSVTPESMRSCSESCSCVVDQG